MHQLALLKGASLLLGMVMGMLQEAAQQSLAAAGVAVHRKGLQLVLLPRWN